MRSAENTSAYVPVDGACMLAPAFAAASAEWERKERAAGRARAFSLEGAFRIDEEMKEN